MSMFTAPRKMKTRQLAINAMLAAMCAVLGYISLDFGNAKITFESLPILLAALLFGPIDGMLVGGVGTLIYQLIRYGVTVTTPLWILPYILCGLAVGLWVKKKQFTLSRNQTVVLVVLVELMITALNTGVLYVDSKIFHYYSAAFIFGSLGIRLVICVVKAVAFGLILPVLVDAVRRAFRFQTA